MFFVIYIFDIHYIFCNIYLRKFLFPEEELVKDMLQIMNIFTAKMNVLRKYKEKD